MEIRPYSIEAVEDSKDEEKSENIKFYLSLMRIRRKTDGQKLQRELLMFSYFLFVFLLSTALLVVAIYFLSN